MFYLVHVLLFNTMKIKLLSDLHLEFGGMDPGEGDVLILAGDILNVNEMKKVSPQGKYYATFLNKCSENYKKVFYVLGNHEHYFGDITKTLKDLQSVLDEESNITILNNSYEEYEGVNFIGGTLWTNYNNEDPDAKLQALNAMTDFQVIVEDELGQIVPNTVIEQHKETMEYLDATLPTLKGPTVVVTHHAPHPTSLSGDYVDSELAPAYYSNLEDFILKHGPDFWCHGHIHHTNDYTIGSTRVLSNPRGYVKYNENPDFNPDFEWTVGEVAQSPLLGEPECATIGE